MDYNKEQKQVIEADLSKNILVSAAAGSGKTTVLTARIINLLSNENANLADDISLSDILIMTFTRKATREMSNRIRKALTKKMQESQGSLKSKLAKDLATIQNANIFTIDAFCKRIVDENYTLLDKDDSLYKGFDPNYRIADENEMAVIKDDILSDLLEERYIDSEYAHLFDSYIEKNDESKIRKLLLDGLAKISCIPWPYKYLSKFCEPEIDSATNVNDILYMKLLREFYLRIINEKNKRSLYEISDYAHIALDILYDEGLSPSARAIADRYKCIFIDEYQDTNFLQEKILEAISDNFKKKNVFMVGDVKQSIYRFRNAEPSIFVDKLKAYKKTNPIGKALTLNINYRSGKEIIEYVNDLFSKVMTHNYGGIDYSDGHELLPTEEESKRDYIDDKKVIIRAICKKSEVDDGDEDTSQNKDKVAKKKPKGADDNGIKHIGVEYEAHFVADEIERLVKEKKYRYNQIVILVRKAAGNSKVYSDILKQHRIPVYSDEKSGFFGRLEVKLVVDILNVIDNPTKNIPLASVLTSDIYGLNNDELSFIKLVQLDGLKSVVKNASKESLTSISYDKNKNIELNLYDAMLYAKNIYDGLDSVSEEEKDNFSAKIKKYNIDGETFKRKVTRFFDDLENTKLRSRYMKISDLIDYIYERYRIKDIVSVMPDAEQRVANLEVLYDFATRFEGFSTVSLFNFNRYIEKISDIDRDKGQAKINDENANAVRIMTIHSAKGLQFDTVFLCGCNQRYKMNEASEKAPYQFGNNYGFALDYYDVDKKVFFNTDKKELLRSEKEDEIRQEELRMLYVGLTRAVNKLYIVGNVQKKGQQGIYFNRLLEKYSDLKGEDLIKENKTKKTKMIKKRDENEDEELAIKNMNSYFDIIVNYLSAKDTPYYNFEIVPYEIKDSKIVEEEFDPSMIRVRDNDDLKIDLEDTYPYKGYQELQPKFSVSALKEASPRHAEVKHCKFETRMGEHSEPDGKATRMGELSEPDVVATRRGKTVQRTVFHCEPDYYDDIDDTRIEKTLSDSTELNGADLGNAYHHFMQYFDFGTASLNSNGKFYEARIDKEKIDVFLLTDLGQEMKQAYTDGTLHREQKFMKLFSQNEIDSLVGGKQSSGLFSTTSPNVFDDKCIIVQGIIDAFYIKKDKDGNDYIVLLDYKTDAIKKKTSDEEKFSQELIDKYKIQLLTYAKVLEDLTGYKVKEIYIYSFAINKAVSIL